MAREAEVLEPPHRALALFRFVATAEPSEQRARPLLGGHQHVLEHGHLWKDLDELERPGDAAAIDLIGGEPRDVLALEPHLPARWPQHAGDAVEERRLAGAVRPDDAEQISRLHVDAHLTQRRDPEEVLGQVADFEKRSHRPTSPLGMNSIMSTTASE